MNKKHADEMKTLGFIIDDMCYPWVAYKGPRFGPTESHFCYTALESRHIRGLPGEGGERPPLLICNFIEQLRQFPQNARVVGKYAQAAGPFALKLNHNGYTSTTATVIEVEIIQ